MIPTGVNVWPKRRERRWRPPGRTVIGSSHRWLANSAVVTDELAQSAAARPSSRARRQTENSADGGATAGEGATDDWRVAQGADNREHLMRLGAAARDEFETRRR